jgi:hypothetical protein
MNRIFFLKLVIEKYFLPITILLTCFVAIYIVYLL